MPFKVAGKGISSRSQIPDFWDSPFWNNIPDRPRFSYKYLVYRDGSESVSYTHLTLPTTERV